MEKKAKIESVKKGYDVRVSIDGMEEVLLSIADMENLMCKYERFTEHVILSCSMPEIPRYSIHDDSIEGTMMPQAFESLDRILVRYRRMTAWMRQNGIDPEAVAGRQDEDKKSMS